MIVISSNPLVVLFNEGYVVLDRFNNKVSFDNAIISINKLKKYLLNENMMSNYSFELMLNRIKKNVAFLNYMAKDSFLNDSRYFKIMAFDFAINHDFEPKLMDVKGSPYYSVKNKDLV